MFASFIYTIKQGISQLARNRAMSFASVFSITAMLLILGVFFVLIVNINMITESVKADYDTIEVFMEDEASKADAEKIISEMKKVDGVEDAEYKTKKEALEAMKESWGEDGKLLENLTENPLPNSVVITINSLEKSGEIAEKAEDFEGVEQVNYYKDTVEKLMKTTDFIQMAAFVIMAFLVIVSVVVVTNTVKITVFARGDEISIMKYVGATNWFVRGPFLVEGLTIGFISSVVSAGIMAAVYSWLVTRIGDDVMIMLSMPMVPVEFFVQNIAVIFIVLGASIGACGSVISMRRFLDV